MRQFPLAGPLPGDEAALSSRRTLAGERRKKQARARHRKGVGKKPFSLLLSFLAHSYFLLIISGFFSVSL